MIGGSCARSSVDQVASEEPWDRVTPMHLDIMSCHRRPREKGPWRCFEPCRGRRFALVPLISRAICA